jgi:hypothetical protein
MRLAERRIYEGELMPRGYGFSYYDYMRRQYVCYPIPFNVLVNWKRKLWEKLQAPSKPELEKRVADAYHRGRIEGYRLRQKQLEQSFEDWKKERKGIE